MSEATMPAAAVRAGRRSPGDLSAIKRIVRHPAAVWFGNPAAEFRAAIDSRESGDVRWFSVAVDAADKPVAAVFYEAGRPAKIPHVRITAVAADPSLGDPSHAAMCAFVLGALVDRFTADVRRKTGGRPGGYVVADVPQTATDAGGALHAAGWSRLQTRAGWSADRFVWFVGGDNGEKEGSD